MTGTMRCEDHWRLPVWPMHSPQHRYGSGGTATLARRLFTASSRQTASDAGLGPRATHRMQWPATDEPAPPAQRALRSSSADLWLTWRVPPVDLAWTSRAGAGDGGRSKRALTCGVLITPPASSLVTHRTWNQTVKSKTADHLASMARRRGSQRLGSHIDEISLTLHVGGHVIPQLGA